MASAQLEAGQGFWLAKQRWLWRRGRLAHEQFLMLQLAGVEMDIDPPLQWQQLAHEAAAYLHGSQLQPDQVHNQPGTAVLSACPLCPDQDTAKLCAGSLFYAYSRLVSWMLTALFPRPHAQCYPEALELPVLQLSQIIWDGT